MCSLSTVFPLTLNAIMTWTFHLLIIVASIFPGSTTRGLRETTVTAQVIRAELDRQAVMRCRIQNKQIIRHVEWIKGVQEENSVFIDSSDPNKKKYIGKRGTFASRNVTGSFLKDGSAYELIIANATDEDEDLYTCSVRKESEEEYRAQVNLTLNVLPHELPAIRSMDGKMLSNVSCNKRDLPILKWFGEISLNCEVKNARPPPVIEWYNSSDGMDVRDLETSSTDLGKTRLGIFTVKRQMDIILQRDEKLRCITYIPSPVPGHLKRVDICIRIHSYDLPKTTNFAHATMTILVFLVVIFAMIHLIYIGLTRQKSSNVLVSQAGWHLIMVMFVTNTVILVHRSYDETYRIALINKYQELPEEPYLLYNGVGGKVALVYWAQTVFHSLVSLMIYVIWIIMEGSKQDRNLTGTPTDPQEEMISTEVDPTERKAKIEPKRSIRHILMHNVCPFFLRLSGGPAYLLESHIWTRYKKKLDNTPDSKITILMKGVILDIIFQGSYLGCAIAMVLTSTDEILGSDMHLRRTLIGPSQALYVAASLDIVVNTFIFLFYDCLSENLRKCRETTPV